MFFLTKIVSGFFKIVTLLVILCSLRLCHKFLLRLSHARIG